MKKKKIISLFMAVVLIGAIGVGATLAYFTDAEEALNVVTMGHVDIELTEPNFDKDDGVEDNKIDRITPGQEIAKDPTITVAEDSEDSFIRVKLVTEANNTVEGVDDMEALILGLLDIDTNNWFLAEDGYYYYQSIMKAGDSATFFNKVTIPETWGNEFSNFGFDIRITAEAIQADNFTPGRNGEGMICAWQYSDGTAITAENYVAPQASAVAE